MLGQKMDFDLLLWGARLGFGKICAIPVLIAGLQAVVLIDYWHLGGI